MPVTVVVGGQFGSEGKGKVAHFMAQQMGATVAVRVGGSNSGHTVVDTSGAPIILRQLPTAAILSETICILPAGSYIDPDILLDEVGRTGLAADRLLIDPNAMLITAQEHLREQTGSLRSTIGSTLSGTGAAVCRRIDRDLSVQLAKHDHRLSKYIKPAVPFMRTRLTAGERIIIEGTQGFGLSLLHSTDYPFVTSRDTTAAAFVSEAWLSPLDIDAIILVLRTFPIRVAGNSGSLPREVDWKTVSTYAESAFPIIERTSVTHLERRVARFHPYIVQQAIAANMPTQIVLNHLDYIDNSCQSLGGLTQKAYSFVERVEKLIGAPINYLGLSPSSLICNQQIKNEVSSL